MFCCVEPFEMYVNNTSDDARSSKLDIERQWRNKFSNQIYVHSQHRTWPESDKLTLNLTTNLWLAHVLVKRFSASKRYALNVVVRHFPLKCVLGKYLILNFYVNNKKKIFIQKRSQSRSIEDNARFCWIHLWQLFWKLLRCLGIFV